MSPVGFLFTVTCVALLLTLPRRWAPLPLLIAATYMTAGQALDLGGLNFTVIRIVAAAGLVRVLVKRERIAGGWQPMDALMAAWAVWAMTVTRRAQPVGVAASPAPSGVVSTAPSAART
jgi:hypothetical protein